LAKDVPPRVVLASRLCNQPQKAVEAGKMGIETVFAHVSCSDIEKSRAWYEKLFGKPPIRRPMPGLVEWQFTESAEFQLYEQKEHVGHCTLTLGVLQLEPEYKRDCVCECQKNVAYSAAGPASEEYTAQILTSAYLPQPKYHMATRSKRLL
jgi:hypothetical protein